MCKCRGRHGCTEVCCRYVQACCMNMCTCVSDYLQEYIYIDACTWSIGCRCTGSHACTGAYQSCGSVDRMEVCGHIQVCIRSQVWMGNLGTRLNLIGGKGEYWPEGRQFSFLREFVSLWAGGSMRMLQTGVHLLLGHWAMDTYVPVLLNKAWLVDSPCGTSTGYSECK